MGEAACVSVHGAIAWAQIALDLVVFGGRRAQVHLRISAERTPRLRRSGRGAIARLIFRNASGRYQRRLRLRMRGRAGDAAVSAPGDAKGSGCGKLRYLESHGRHRVTTFMIGKRPIETLEIHLIVQAR